MSTTAYFWKEGEIVEFSDFPAVDNVVKANLNRLYCVDITTKYHQQRYGIFQDSWVHHPVETFPLEFRTALLLLGVT